MEIIEKSCIPGILQAIARNVEGGQKDIRLFAEHRNEGWALWAANAPGTWRFSVHISGPFQRPMLVVELETGTTIERSMCEPIGPSGWQAWDIVREVSAWFHVQ